MGNGAAQPQPPHVRATAETLLSVYQRLLSHYGPQHWWPAADSFEVIIGAILTQSAAWSNVEKAIANLKAERLLTPAELCQVPLERLARLIYPSGYYNAKAMKIKAFVQWLGEGYGGRLDRLFALEVPPLRQALLSVRGIGEETADSIILYAARKPVFVIDAYTRRIFSRLGLKPQPPGYSALQRVFMEHLPHEEALFNEYHALLVCHGKETCRRVPRCEPCCLGHICAFSFSASAPS